MCSGSTNRWPLSYVCTCSSNVVVATKPKGPRIIAEREWQAQPPVMDGFGFETRGRGPQDG